MHSASAAVPTAPSSTQSRPPPTSAGFATLWSGEHVVMVDESASRYPYSDDGRIAVPAEADWIDPLIGLSFAAAATSTIRIATGVLLLPEHNPVLVAKQAATLDTLSGGRLTLGIGIGWSREEFDALGVPFERRGARTEEYVDAIRTLWRDDVASFDGEFVRFDVGAGQPEAGARPSHSDRARRQQRCSAAPGGGVGRRLVRVQPRQRRGGSRTRRLPAPAVRRAGPRSRRTAGSPSRCASSSPVDVAALADIGDRRIGDRRGPAGRRARRRRLGGRARRSLDGEDASSPVSSRTAPARCRRGVRSPSIDTSAGTSSLVTSPCSLVSSSMMSKLAAMRSGASTTIVVTGTRRASWINLSPCGS